MLPKFKTAAITTVTALSLALSAAAPAQALGKNERNFIKGAAAAALVGVLLHENAKRNQEPPRYAPQPQPPRQDWNNGRGQDRYYDQGHYRQNDRDRGRVVGQDKHTNSVYNTIAAQSFNSYSASQRRQIQQSLRNFGYYRGGIDGSFGPGTYSAVVAYARDAGGTRQLETRAGTFGIYDRLIY